MKRKIITLYPTDRTLHVFQRDWENREQEAKLMSKLYGGDHVSNEKHIGEFKTFATSLHPQKGQYEGMVIYVIFLDKTLCDSGTIVHECNHILHYISKDLGLEISYEAQEWNSYFLDYVFQQVSDLKGYKTIK